VSVHRRALIGVSLTLAVLVSTACSANSRSANELFATSFGTFPTPAGSALVSEFYSRASPTPTGPNCASLERTFVSNDLDGFWAAYLRAAERNSVRWSGGAAPHGPVVQHPDHSRHASVFETAGTSVSLDVHDLDNAGERRGRDWVDVKAWRYIVVLRVRDQLTRYGGGCSMSVLGSRT